MIAFLLLLFTLIVIFVYTSQSNEGFTGTQKPEAPAKPNVPTKSNAPTIPSTVPVATPPGSEPPQKGTVGEVVSPHTLPGGLPMAPYGQIANMSPLPYQDTTQIKANRQQIVSLLEMLKGFLAFEAQELLDRSDPSIQLPLSNARSDFQVLQNAVDLLNRNPGLQPNITLTNLNEMSANLAHLQEQVRLSGSGGVLRGPSPVEGFTANTSEVRATVGDLTAFITRITSEITKLSSSGTTDPIKASRIAALTQLKNNVQSIINNVNSGTIQATKIPILKSDVDNAFPALSNTNQSLSSALQTAGLSTALANLVAPNANANTNSDVMNEVTEVINKYADQILNGVSATFNVKYISPRETELMHASSSTVDKLGFPSASDLDHVSNAQFMPADMGAHVTDQLAPTPGDAGRGPSAFDWKKRASEIEHQVKQRGLNPNDFGIMPEGTQVSNDFSWKGYTRMMCTRLQATTEDRLAETCGCPPMDWKGWRIAK
jgi:hypothetical protein